MTFAPAGVPPVNRLRIAEEAVATEADHRQQDDDQRGLLRGASVRATSGATPVSGRASSSRRFWSSFFACSKSVSTASLRGDRAPVRPSVPQDRHVRGLTVGGISVVLRALAQWQGERDGGDDDEERRQGDEGGHCGFLSLVSPSSALARRSFVGGQFGIGDGVVAAAQVAG